jgi:hypothetical protein
MLLMELKYLLLVSQAEHFELLIGICCLKHKALNETVVSSDPFGKEVFCMQA